MRHPLFLLCISCLFVGCSQPAGSGNANSGSPVPAPTQTTTPVATQSAAATDVVATVLGQPVKRSDCLSPSHGIGSVEVGIYAVVFRLLMDDFSKSQQVTLSQDQIDAFWKAHRAGAQRANPDPSKPAPEPVFDEAAVQTRLKRAQDKLAAADLPLLEQLALQSQVAGLQRGLELKSPAAMTAYENLLPLRLEAALYKKYGGKVVARQISLQAAGAYQKLAEEVQANGKLVFHDEALKQAFWKRLQDDLAHPEIPPERVDFSLPAWMQGLAQLPPGSATTALAPNLAAGDPRQKPKELEAVGRYVGDWTTDVTSKPAEWAPHEVKYRCSNHAEFVSNGWFLQHIEVSHIVGEPDQVTKTVWFQTFDATSKKYVTWWFSSTGIISHSTGSWDAASQSFNYTEVEPPQGTTHRFTERFRDAESHEGSLAFTGNGGRKMLEMDWTRTRQQGVVPNALKEKWAKIGTPIQPIPDEVKKLEPFVGAKDVEFIHRPSITSPQGSTIMTVTTGEWILDGRFVLARTGLGEKQSFFVSGYDSNKRAFRYVRFGFNGEVEENIGQWNEATRSFEWKGVGDATGRTRTSTSRVLSDGAVETHILTKTQDGKVQMDLTIKSTPRK